MRSNQPRRLLLPALLLAMLALPAHAATPAQVQGLWCGTGPLHEFSLRLTQRLQEVEGLLSRRGRDRELHGRIDGSVLRTQSTKVGALVLEARRDELLITGGDGIIALARGTSFRRAAGGSCGG
jgi:hypothetical protein